MSQSAATTRQAAVDKYLLPHEEVRVHVRRHPAVLIGPSALALLGLLAAGVLNATVLSTTGVLADVVWLVCVLLILRLVWKAANWYVDYFVVTTNRMLLTTGVFTRRIAMMPLAKVTDMSFRRTFGGRLMGYGDFIVESAGQDQALRTVDHIPYPEHIYLRVCEMLFPSPHHAEDEEQTPDDYERPDHRRPRYDFDDEDREDPDSDPGF